MALNPVFDDDLRRQVQSGSLMLMLCRSGVRPHCEAAQRTAELGYEAYNALEEFEGALLDEEVHRGRMGTGTYVVCPGYKRERLTIDAWPHAKSRITSGFFKNTVSAARRGRILNGGVQVGEVSKTSGSSNARRSHLSGDFPSPGSMSIGSRKYRTTFAADSSILEAIRQERNRLQYKSLRMISARIHRQQHVPDNF